MQDELDTILASRAVPLAPPDLAERIIARAARQSVRRKYHFAEAMNILGGFFAVPQPALALALTLLLGLTLGFNLNTASVGITTDDLLASFTAADDNPEGAMP